MPGTECYRCGDDDHGVAECPVLPPEDHERGTVRRRRSPKPPPFFAPRVVPDARVAQRGAAACREAMGLRASGDDDELPMPDEW